MKIIGLCRLTRDIEMRTTQRGTPMAKFGVAWNTKFGGEEKAHFVDCTAFGKTAEVLAQYAGKGSQLLLEGRLEYEQWEKDGAKRSKHGLMVDNFQFAGPKQEKREEAGRSTSQSNPDIPF